jgi:hypothetical protein
LNCYAFYLNELENSIQHFPLISVEFSSQKNCIANNINRVWLVAGKFKRSFVVKLAKLDVVSQPYTQVRHFDIVKGTNGLMPGYPVWYLRAECKSVPDRFVLDPLERLANP